MTKPARRTARRALVPERARRVLFPTEWAFASDRPRRRGKRTGRIGAPVSAADPAKAWRDKVFILSIEQLVWWGIPEDAVYVALADLRIGGARSLKPGGLEELHRDFRQEAARDFVSKAVLADRARFGADPREPYFARPLRRGVVGVGELRAMMPRTFRRLPVGTLARLVVDRFSQGKRPFASLTHRWLCHVQDRLELKRTIAQTIWGG